MMDPLLSTNGPTVECPVKDCIDAHKFSLHGRQTWKVPSLADDTLLPLIEIDKLGNKVELSNILNEEGGVRPPVARRVPAGDLGALGFAREK